MTKAGAAEAVPDESGFHARLAAGGSNRERYLCK
jgi:hypothetical protein